MKPLRQFQIVGYVRRQRKEGIMVGPELPLLVRTLRRLCRGPSLRMGGQWKVAIDQPDLLRVQPSQFFKNSHAFLADRTLEVSILHDRDRRICRTDGGIVAVGELHHRRVWGSKLYRDFG